MKIKNAAEEVKQRVQDQMYISFDLMYDLEGELPRGELLFWWSASNHIFRLITHRVEDIHENHKRRQ